MTKFICKVSLLAGRPIAFLGVLAIVNGFWANEPMRFVVGLLLISVGFVVAWIGKIGLFMLE